MIILSKWLRNRNFHSHGRIRMNQCAKCGMHLSQFYAKRCTVVYPKYPDPNGKLAWLRRLIWAKCFVWTAKRIAYVHHETEYKGDYVDWYGVADWFERAYWHSAKGRE